MTQEFIGTKIVTAWLQDKDGKPGYAVKYSDGYTSWSPKEVFEESYLPIGHVSYKSAFVQRLIGERAQLNEKITKLRAFISSDAGKKVGGIDGALLLEQLDLMIAYRDVVSKRLDRLDSDAAQSN